MRADNLPILTSPVALNANYASDPIPCAQVVSLSIQVVVSATVNGTFQLETSNDKGTTTLMSPVAGSVNNDLITHWNVYPGSAVVQNTAGILTWDFQHTPPFNWIRITFTDASGGTSNGHITSINVFVKGI